MTDLTSDPPRKEGTYWGIADGSQRGARFYNDEAAHLIASIRTDLNRFTRAEFESLINHGYLKAAEKTSSFARQLLENPRLLDQIELPYSEWQSVERLKLALRRSASRLTPYRWR